MAVNATTTHTTTVVGADEAGKEINKAEWNGTGAHSTLVTIDDNTLVAAKLSATATSILFGRTTAGAGAGEEIVAASGVIAFLVTPSSANLRTALTDESGTGSLVFADTPTLTTPVLAGTPDAAGEIGRDSTQLAANYYDNGAVGRVSRVVAAGVGTETFTNSTASDQDFTTAIFTTPANAIFTNKRYRLTLEYELTTGVSSVTLITYVKLGATKVVAHSAVDFTNSVTRSVSMVYNICGREAAGAAANVTSMPVGNPFLPAGAANTVNQPVALATNGTLAITPGVTYSGTGSTETIELQSWMVEELN